MDSSNRIILSIWVTGYKDKQRKDFTLEKHGFMNIVLGATANDDLHC